MKNLPPISHQSEAPNRGIMARMVPDIFEKPYSPTTSEPKVLEQWDESGYSNPDTCIKKGVCAPDAEAFSIVLPPPNVTGTLHTGHASMLAIEDTIIRFRRMQGKKTLWLPGTDHAGIATQSKVEKLLEKDGVRKQDLGRDEFLKRVEQFAQESHDTIVSQVKRMGASVDWTREAFTLDEARSLAVRTTFKKMHDDGLIYRGYKVINWDPKGQTVISDDEVNHEERQATLYTFRYSKDFPIPIATTRPETKVGDTGVAVNPNDPRYAEHIGKTFDVTFCGVPLSIKVVGDESADMEFGTGAVGITPAHSQTDAQMAERHGLPMVQVIDERAKMMVGGEELMGKKTTEAREAVVAWLQSEGLLEKEEPITHNVSVAERSGGVIEPLPKTQWFVAVNKTFDHNGKQTTLKEIMRESVAGGNIQILPERFDKTYFHWIDNLHDWCISRQLWYGHRIPVWYRGEETHVGITAPEGDGWEQDPDTLDTWFSSALWTFSTLGWPQQTDDLATYHPTSVLETGYDIIFFWVARMILMSGYLLDEVPFKTVYLHGLVRDEKGRKMSKSLGNIVDPLDLIDKHGTDALRMALIVGIGPGADNNLSENKIKAYSKFANKLWNITRFTLGATEGVDLTKKPTLHADDEARVVEIDALAKEITNDMELYRFYLAGEKLYHYAWHTFADIIIEGCKEHLTETADPERSASTRWMLAYLLTNTLKLLHPFMPFVTEAIWGHLPYKNADMLMVAPWPAPNK
ncbi:MAG: valyl-tRNA synthetase, valyl-tRNA synthetase [Candidatus Parcubacteria bacterium]|jgi:valyl-tRNA synthetase